MPGFHYTANATTTIEKQSDYKVEQSSFLIALFSLEIGRCRSRNWLYGNQALLLLRFVTGTPGRAENLRKKFIPYAMAPLFSPPPPSRLNDIMIARLFIRSSLRSVNRPIGPWLSTHDEATRVLWHREGRTFFQRFFALPGFPVVL